MNDIRIACVNSEPVAVYRDQGWSPERLARYYNPASVASEVRVFARHETDWEMSSSVKATGYESFDDLLRKCRRFRPHVIRCYEGFQPSCDEALRLSLVLGIPSYLSLHDAAVPAPPRFAHFTMLTAYTDTLAASRAAELHRPVELQLNGIPSDIFRPREEVRVDPRVNNSRYRIFTITRRDPRKNLDTMIRATSLFAERNPGTAHVIAGPGSEDVPFDGVHLGLGPLVDRQISEYLTWCQCFLQVQLVGDIGMAHAEALMIGRPIVVAGHPEGNAREVVNDHRGVIVPLEKARNSDEIARALETCLHRSYDSDGIRNFALERYGENQLREKEAQRYRLLVSGGSPGGRASAPGFMGSLLLRADLRWSLAQRLYARVGKTK